MEGSRTRWFHSFPAVSHRSVQDWLVATFQPAGRLRRLVGCFSLIVSFRETYQRPFSSSKQHTRSLKIFPGGAGCSSSNVRDRWSVEMKMHEGQEQEADSRLGSQPYRAAALLLAFSEGFLCGTVLHKTAGYLDSHMHLPWGHRSCHGKGSRGVHWCQKEIALGHFPFSSSFFHAKVKKKINSGVYLLLFHLFYFHFSLLGAGGAGEHIDGGGHCHKTWVSHLACVCVSSFLSLIPDYFLPSGDSWFGRAERGAAPQAALGTWRGVGGRATMAGRPELCLRLPAGDQRQREVLWKPVGWPPLAALQLGPFTGLFSASPLPQGPTGNRKWIAFLSASKRSFDGQAYACHCCLIPSRPSCADPGAPALALAGWQVTFPRPTGAPRGSKPRHGARLGHSTSTATCARGRGLCPPRTAPAAVSGFQEQEMATCRVFTVCFPSSAFFFFPHNCPQSRFWRESALPEDVVGATPKRSRLLVPCFGGLRADVHRAGIPPQRHGTGETSQQWCEEAAPHRVVSRFCGQASEAIYPSFCAPRERSRNWLK